VFQAQVDTDLCDGCQDCIDLCYFDAIALVRLPKQKRMKAAIDLDRCCGCNNCSPSCPQEGIIMVPIRELEEFLLKQQAGAITVTA